MIRPVLLLNKTASDFFFHGIKQRFSSNDDDAVAKPH